MGLTGPVRPHAAEADLVDTELDTRLTRWAGRYGVEWADHELTLHGARSLDPDDAGRVREGFELAERLRRRAEELVAVAPEGAAPQPTPSGVPVPRSSGRVLPAGRKRRP